MKKTFKMALMIMLIISLFSPHVVYANMAAPSLSDVGSAITFEKNEEIAVLSEILNITVSGAKAHIVATYRMMNTTNKSVSTQSMFLSPDIESSDVSVVINNESVDYIAESYALKYSTGIKADDWRYTVLIDESDTSHDEENVDTIAFQMSFAPKEEYDVVVSYNYRLGGYPNYNWDAKDGRIHYYLTPAALWKDFSSLTINLYLDQDMPILKSSNLEFKKTDTRTYQYISDTLPDANLQIVIDENGWQEIWSFLRSPYLSMTLMMFSPIILIVLAVIIFIVWRFSKWKKRRIEQSRAD